MVKGHEWKCDNCGAWNDGDAGHSSNKYGWSCDYCDNVMYPREGAKMVWRKKRGIPIKTTGKIGNPEWECDICGQPLTRHQEFGGKCPRCGASAYERHTTRWAKLRTEHLSSPLPQYVVDTINRWGQERAWKLGEKEFTNWVTNYTDLGTDYGDRPEFKFLVKTVAKRYAGV